MKKYSKILALVLSFVMIFALAACGGSKEPAQTPGTDVEGTDNSAQGNAEDKKIVLGFSQVGAESEWRSANTESSKSS